MTHSLRTALFAALVLAAPLAFAQDATAGQAQASQAQVPETAPPPASPAPAQTSEKKSWADVDTDKDGALSRDEAATIPALAEAFDAADTDADGKLTAEEYKAHAAGKDGDKAPAANR